MRRLFALSPLVIATIAAAPPSVAHPLAGKWSIEYERGRQVMNDEVTVITGKATLEITQRGDSLIATLTPVDAGPVQRLAGTGSGSSATFKSTNTVHIDDDDGNVQTVAVTITWELKADGDNLSGTLTREAPGRRLPGGAAPVKGTRAK